MRPDRPDIAAPEFPPRLRWIVPAPGAMAELTAAGPALVHFFDFAQLNSVRALPYVIEWDRRYRPAGLTVIGVQAPRFPFGSDPSIVAAAIARLGIGYPVALDAERELWRDYGCRGWPSLFLWGQGGALRWAHFGEGEYRATEEAIQEELREADPLRELPAPMGALRASDEPGALVMPPDPPEWFPAEEPGRSWSPGRRGELIELDYEAGGVHVTAEGVGELRAQIDAEPLPDVKVEGPGLYELVIHAMHEEHTLYLGVTEGVRIWSISFAAGVPG